MVACGSVFVWAPHPPFDLLVCEEKRSAFLEGRAIVDEFGQSGDRGVSSWALPHRGAHSKAVERGCATDI